MTLLRLFSYQINQTNAINYLINNYLELLENAKTIQRHPKTTIVNNLVDNILQIEFLFKSLFLFLRKLKVMTNRSNDLIQMRPSIPTALVNDSMSSEERFQNATIRPLLMLQNDLLIEVFKNYIAKHKNVFYELSLPKQLDYIENAIYKDIKFRNSIKGMIIGQFTLEEYAVYIQNSSALNKRIMNLVRERFIGHIQLFKPEIAQVI